MNYEIKSRCGGEITTLVVIDEASTDVLSVDTDDYVLIHRELLARARCGDGAAATLLRAELMRGAVQCCHCRHALSLAHRLPEDNVEVTHRSGWVTCKPARHGSTLAKICQL